MNEPSHYGRALSDACSGYAALKPPNRMRISQGAAKNLVIKQTGGSGGAWDASETPYMVAPMDALASRQHEAVIFVGPARTGKCLDVSTRIPTPSGWTTMGALAKGDTVFGTDGAEINVVAAHDTKHGLPCFEVRLSDGSTLVADSEHLWGVERFYWRAPHWRYEVRTTAQLLDDLTYATRSEGRSRFRYRIRNVAPLQCAERGLQIDPYLLGVWLGNGTAAAPSFCSHVDDAPHYEQAARAAGHTAESRHDGPNTVMTRLDMIATGPTDIFGTFAQRLRSMHLLQNKHIPAEYLRASADQRLALLRGLMDTDGYPGDDAHTSVEFSTVSTPLMLGFCELARSLGLKPITKLKETTWTHDGERRFGTAYRITFPVPEGVSVFTLPRKAANCRGASIDVGFRQIVAIVPVASRPVRCIQVDAPDQMFLAGEGLVPTHNTAGLLLGWMAHNIVNDPGDMLFIQMSKEKAREFSKTDVSRSLRNSPNVQAMRTGRRDDSNTHDEMFRHGMWLRIAWPTVGNVSGSTYRYTACTDYDRIDNAENVDGEGPLFDLMKKRTATFLSRGMSLVESSPGYPLLDPHFKPVTPHEAPPTGGILNLYNRSDRERWYWPCRDCHSHFEAAPGLALFGLPSDNDIGDEIRSMNIPAFAEKYARVICPCCGSIIEPKWKQSLNKAGIWVPDSVTVNDDGTFTGTPMTSTIKGYWLGGAAAAFQSWKSIIENHLYGLRDYALTGSEEKLKQTTNTDQGAPYMSRHLVENKGQGATPQDRAEVGMPRYVVPPETRCLLAAVDVQGGVKSRFVVQLHAVGVYGEQWLVDRFELKESMRPGMGAEFAPIDPAAYPEDWDVLTEKLLRATWKTPDSTREIKIKRLVVDSGGEDGVTQNAYAWYRRVRKAGMSGRVRLYKGGSDKKAPIIKETMVGRAKGKGDVPLLVCNPNLLSDAVAAGLKRQGRGPGYIHFPAPKHPTLNPDGWLPQAFFDELEAETRNANGVWVQNRPRNESFDLCRMIHACMLCLAVDKIKDWNVVPPWLAPLDQNSEIVSVEDRRAMKENPLLPAPEPAPVRVLAPKRRPRRHAYAAI